MPPGTPGLRTLANAAAGAGCTAKRANVSLCNKSLEGKRRAFAGVSVVIADGWRSSSWDCARGPSKSPSSADSGEGSAPLGECWLGRRGSQEQGSQAVCAARALQQMMNTHRGVICHQQPLTTRGEFEARAASGCRLSVWACWAENAGAACGKEDGRRDHESYCLSGWPGIGYSQLCHTALMNTLPAFPRPLGGRYTVARSLAGRSPSCSRPPHREA